MTFKSVMKIIKTVAIAFPRPKANTHFLALEVNTRKNLEEKMQDCDWEDCCQNNDSEQDWYQLGNKNREQGSWWQR